MSFTYNQSNDDFFICGCGARIRNGVMCGKCFGGAHTWHSIIPPFGPTNPEPTNIPPAAPAQTGWLCPKCGTANAPHQNTCGNCTPPQEYKVTC
jgi:hypothetical protein